jgi:hypothetical protein
MIKRTITPIIQGKIGRGKAESKLINRENFREFVVI